MPQRGPPPSQGGGRASSLQAIADATSASLKTTRPQLGAAGKGTTLRILHAAAHGHATPVPPTTWASLHPSCRPERCTAPNVAPPRTLHRPPSKDLQHRHPPRPARPLSWAPGLAAGGPHLPARFVLLRLHEPHPRTASFSQDEHSTQCPRSHRTTTHHSAPRVVRPRTSFRRRAQHPVPSQSPHNNSPPLRPSSGLSMGDVSRAGRMGPTWVSDLGSLTGHLQALGLSAACEEAYTSAVHSHVAAHLEGTARWGSARGARGGGRVVGRRASGRDGRPSDVQALCCLPACVVVQAAPPCTLVSDVHLPPNEQRRPAWPTPGSPPRRCRNSSPHAG
ncbi:MAG: hypothetical protein WDW36_003944 [Sanguina aurantia]